jgi:methylmalonyl-CoA/ethylmalonyl-CoA epimerase
MSERFGGIDHLGIAVADLEAATRLYRDVLGFAVSGGEFLPDRGLEVRFVETGNSRIELLGATRGDSEISAFLERRGEGIHHLCLAVNDIEGTVAGMRERGARIVGAGIQRGAHGNRVAFIHPKSTHGVLIELVEKTEIGK